MRALFFSMDSAKTSNQRFGRGESSSSSRRSTLAAVSRAALCCLVVVVGAGGLMGDAAKQSSVASSSSAMRASSLFSSALSPWDSSASSSPFAFIKGAAAHDHAGMPPLPDPFHTEQLDDATFESVVFPEDTPVDKQRPYLVMFYSPSCSHCRMILPLFNNASISLFDMGPNFKADSTRLAVVDAITNTRLASAYEIRSFPTFYYTINGRAHRYHQPQTTASFISTALVIYKGFTSGTFATDVSSLRSFVSAAVATIPRKPWFIMCRPARPAARLMPDDATILVQSMVTYGMAQFVTIYEDEAPSMNDRPLDLSTADGAAVGYWSARDACVSARIAAHSKDAKMKVSLGPKGEIMMLWSDRTATPMAYTGPAWGNDEDELGMGPHIISKGSNNFRPSRQLATWVWENSYNGVEKLSADILGVVAKRARLGIFVFDGDLDFQMDTRYLPAVLNLAQQRYADYQEDHVAASSGVVADLLKGALQDDFVRAGQAARMWLKMPTQFLLVDGIKYKEWLAGLGVGGDAAPHFFVLDAVKETVWRLDEWAPVESQGLVSKASATGGFAVDGTEIQLIDAFLNDVEGVKAKPHRRRNAAAISGKRGSLKGPTSTTSYGRVVRFMVDYIPFANWLLIAVGDDDLKFLIAIAAAIGWSTAFLVSLRRQPDDDEVGTPLVAGRKFV